MHSPASVLNSTATHLDHLCDELNDTTSLLNLLLGVFGNVAGADDDGNLGQTALAKDLGVAEGKEVKNGGFVGLLGKVLLALLSGDEGPELVQVDDGLPELLLGLVAKVVSGDAIARAVDGETYK